MINIYFSVNQIDESLSEFELGDIEIEIDGQIISSKNKKPNQSMMVFIAISDLLDGLRGMIVNGKKEFVFVGADSSFILLFKQGKNVTHIVHNSKKYDISLTEFASSLRISVNSFLEEKEQLLDKKSAVMQDLYNSLNNFPATP